MNLPTSRKEREKWGTPFKVGVSIQERRDVGHPPDLLVVHDDTVSPWTGPFTFGALFTGNFWEHGIVDLVGGTFFVGAFPQ